MCAASMALIASGVRLGVNPGCSGTGNEPSGGPGRATAGSKANRSSGSTQPDSVDCLSTMTLSTPLTPASANVAPAAAATAAGMGSRKAGFYRHDLDGLRGVAILLVAAFHIWFGRVSGGVDVFLVLSGFLITGSLYREMGRTGRIDIVAFWARI